MRHIFTMRLIQAKPLLIVLSLFLIAGKAAAQKKYNPKSYFDSEKWVEYIEGNIPLVISVPHGGRVTSDTLPIRSCPDAIITVDAYTIELAKAIQSYFLKNFNVSPHIIISHLARKHVDQNRELENGGTCNFKPLDKAWHSFHNYIDSAVTIAGKKESNVMYIDLHGHAHANQRLEMGYNISRVNLYAIKNGTGLKVMTPHSLSNLLQKQPSLSLKELIFGTTALGTLVAGYGAPSVPSAQDPLPAQNELYFSGGPNTRRFTNEKYPNVFGLQLECNKDARFTPEGRKTTAEALCKGIVDYFAITRIWKLKEE